MQSTGSVLCLAAMRPADELSGPVLRDRALEVSLEHHNAEQPGPPRSFPVRDTGWRLSAGNSVQLEPVNMRKQR
ncbi:hypothetical protein CesoFtcFv8_013232 [Champsocephalus esox]|uniref:Uncharacterized protein n=2 Tax=Champsocephalus TaxID=52236 RepID=A0AAN8HSU5_CHAGU|nr:hypothetical protein CesoFtcFv8_013232 [Champsocephalus esox]KAK5922839.1 hypothetical protein CgunFtcFv8_020070 [Champsocephalus gunnari]